MNKFANAARVHTALTAGPEKRLLTWMAHRTPRAIGPDHLTALALASQISPASPTLGFARPQFLWLVNACLGALIGWR